MIFFFVCVCVVFFFLVGVGVCGLQGSGHGSAKVTTLRYIPSLQERNVASSLSNWALQEHSWFSLGFFIQEAG